MSSEHYDTESGSEYRPTEKQVEIEERLAETGSRIRTIATTPTLREDTLISSAFLALGLVAIYHAGTGYGGTGELLPAILIVGVGALLGGFSIKWLSGVWCEVSDGYHCSSCKRWRADGREP
jgi:hypothetical protein